MKLDPRLQQFRIVHPILGEGEGNNGCFQVPCYITANNLTVISSDGEGWDHVSVSLPNRCPNWQEMCFVKDLFFDKEEAVMQLHPAASRYKNFHPYCLHMWRPQDSEIPLPPDFMVAP